MFEKALRALVPPPACKQLSEPCAPVHLPARSWLGRVDELVRQMLSMLRFQEGLYDGVLLWWSVLVGVWGLAALAFPE